MTTEQYMALALADEWQELATRLAEEAGVDAEQMLAQARDATEDKT